MDYEFWILDSISLITPLSFTSLRSVTVGSEGVGVWGCLGYLGIYSPPSGGGVRGRGCLLFWCRALPHFHKHLFSFRYCLRHHLNECEHAAGRVEHISFAAVETEEDASPCVFWLIPRMNPYPLKTLHVQQQRQPSSEPSAACDEDAITPCGDSSVSLVFCNRIVPNALRSVRCSEGGSRLSEKKRLLTYKRPMVYFAW